MATKANWEVVPDQRLKNLLKADREFFQPWREHDLQVLGGHGRATGTSKQSTETVGAVEAGRADLQCPFQRGTPHWLSSVNHSL